MDDRIVCLKCGTVHVVNDYKNNAPKCTCGNEQASGYRKTGEVPTPPPA